MNLKGITALISACLISSPLLAQTTMVTELNAGDSWLEIGYTKSKNEFTFVDTHNSFFNNYYDYYSTDYEYKESNHIHYFDVNFMTVAKTNGAFKPTIGFSFNRISSGDNKATVKNLSIGKLFILEGERQGFLEITYANSNKSYLVRDAIKGQLSFEMSERDSILRNQLSLNATYKKKYQGTTGGHIYTLSNKTKLIFNSKLDVILNLGTSIISKEKSDFGEDINYDSVYSYGGELNIHPSKNLTLKFGLLTTEREGDYVTSEFDQKESKVSLSLLSRF